MITAHCQNNHTYNLSTDGIFSNHSYNYFGLISQYPRDDDSDNVTEKSGTLPREWFPTTNWQCRLRNEKSQQKHFERNNILCEYFFLIYDNEHQAGVGGFSAGPLTQDILQWYERHLHITFDECRLWVQFFPHVQ